MSGRGSPRRKLSCSVISGDLERRARPDRNPLYAAADPPASGRCPTARGPSVRPRRLSRSPRSAQCVQHSSEKEDKGVAMAELDTTDRQKMDKRKFAYVDKEGEGHLPINDDAHVRNAMARFNQTDFESGTEKETARKKIVTAAKRRGIKVAKKDNVAKGRKTG